MFVCCPYLGTAFDKTVPRTVPDNDNVCYAQYKQYRKYMFMKKAKIGVRIKLTYQKNKCYCNYTECKAFLFKKKQNVHLEAVNFEEEAS